MGNYQSCDNCKRDDVYLKTTCLECDFAISNRRKLSNSEFCDECGQKDWLMDYYKCIICTKNYCESCINKHVNSHVSPIIKYHQHK